MTRASVIPVGSVESRLRCNKIPANVARWTAIIAHVDESSNILCEARLITQDVVASRPYQLGTHGDEMA